MAAAPQRRTVTIYRNFCGKNVRKIPPNAKGPPEDYGREKHTTVAAFLPWRGS